MAKKTKRSGVTVSVVSAEGIAESVLAEKDWQVEPARLTKSRFATSGPTFPVLVSALEAASTNPGQDVTGQPNVTLQGYPAYGQTVESLKRRVDNGRPLPAGPGYMDKKPMKS